MKGWRLVILDGPGGYFERIGTINSEYAIYQDFLKNTNTKPPKQPLTRNIHTHASR